MGIKGPFYSITDVRLAASAGRVVFGTPRMQIDATELGYSREAVIRVLKNLTIEQFYKSYPNGKFRLDAYKVSTLSSTGQIDDLYIKFALRGLGKSSVLLVSFHLNR